MNHFGSAETGLSNGSRGDVGLKFNIESSTRM